MNRFVRTVTLITMGGIVLWTQVVEGQGPQPAPAPATGAPAGDLGTLTQAMAERVRQLGEAIAADLGKTPSGPVLLQDARELAQAVDEFHKAVPGMASPLRRRQRFGGIDASWHHLLIELRRPGVTSQGVDAVVRRVTEVDAQIHQVLGSNPYPKVYYGSQASPGGMPEIARLAHALVDRAEALLTSVRADVPGPIGSRVAEEVSRLLQSANAFHDGLNLDARLDDRTREGFAAVVSASELLAADLARMARQITVPDRVRAAWHSFQTTETLIRQALKLPIPQADLRSSAISNEGRATVFAQADGLVAALDNFLIVFTPAARNVAEGGEFIADARRLRGAVANFREAIPRAIDVSQLAAAYRDVDVLWQRLARRTNRIAFGEGRGGPDLPRIEGIGQAVTEIHRLLGIPGFPAELGPFNEPG